MSNLNKSVMNAVLGYTPKENDRESNRQDELGKGWHDVNVVEMKVTHSRLQWSGVPKTNLPPYDDPTPQLGFMFRNEEGIAFAKINVYGYKRWKDLSTAEQESGKYERLEHHGQSYACKEKDGKFIRIKDSKRTAGAQSIIDQFIDAVGMTGQGKLGDMLDTIEGDRMALRIEIKPEVFNGETYNNVVGYAPVEDVVTVEDDANEFGE